ncbi:MAG TPA: hypothetical protein VK752_12410 [Bryobacteraceae bacterium]|nr:hypothetical protein [Bryobacteraceae bacterium]
MDKRKGVSVLLLFSSVVTARAGVTLFLEEPYGTFGGMNPTGHAAIYLSHVCAATPVSLRQCNQGEHGVVISRYHRVSGYDWIAIPLLPYLYAVDQPDDVPWSVNPEDVAALRDAYRRTRLHALVPDAEDGLAPKGDWIQLVGSSYDRTIYAFGVESTEEQDDALIQEFNSRGNKTHFNLFFFNCADFARKTFDFYYPRAIHRSLLNDAGIMTPKQAARSLVSYTKRHQDMQFSILVIPQVQGTVPRSTAVRGVLESLVKSKRYALPLVTVAVLHPYFGGSLAFAWIEGSRFDPRRMVGPESVVSIPASIEVELQSNRVGGTQ